MTAWNFDKGRETKKEMTCDTPKGKDFLNHYFGENYTKVNVTKQYSTFAFSNSCKDKKILYIALVRLEFYIKYQHKEHRNLIRKGLFVSFTLW